jgi:ferrous iron transport protein A
MKKRLVDMKKGEVGRICEIDGGHGLLSRLHSMGIRAGKRVKKVSAQPLSGPVALEIDNFCIAIGHGMAKKIYVEGGGAS